MITQKTAAALHNCHQQIINSEKLIADVKSALDRAEPTRLIDAFGRRCTIEMGIPSGGSGHRILNVDNDLALLVIEAQIEKYKSQLKALNEIAKDECMKLD